MFLLSPIPLLEINVSQFQLTKIKLFMNKFILILKKNEEKKKGILREIIQYFYVTVFGEFLLQL